MNTIKSAINEARQSKVLDLSNLGLNVLPPEICNTLSTENIEALHLTGNSFSFIPNEIQRFLSLKDLWIDDNLLTEFPNSILSLAKLEFLSLEGNLIQEIPNWIIELKRLERIDLGRNKIKEIPDWLGLTSALKWIDLDSNLIAIPPKHTGNLRVIRIANNPIDCTLLTSKVYCFKRYT